MIGRTIGPYRVVEKLGEGGMGEVYRAHDAKLRRDVAIKVLPQTVTSTTAGLARFEREARLLATLLFYARSSNEGQARGRGMVAAVDMMAVEVTTQPTLAFSQPRQLFAGSYSMNGPARGYDVTRDGQRFLMLQPRPRAPDLITEIKIVQNWSEELREGAGARSP